MFLLVVCVFFPNKNTRPPDNINMSSPFCQVAWECGDCTNTNQGREHLPCLYCHAKNPRRYGILAGSALAATAQMTYVMCTEQHDIIRAATVDHVAIVPRPIIDCALLAEHLWGTMVDIVGMEIGENGRMCHAHEVCGSQLVPGSKVGI